MPDSICDRFVIKRLDLPLSKAAAASTAAFAFLGSSDAPPFLFRCWFGEMCPERTLIPTILPHEQNENCQVDRHFKYIVKCLFEQYHRKLLSTIRHIKNTLIHKYLMKIIESFYVLFTESGKTARAMVSVTHFVIANR